MAQLRLLSIHCNTTEDVTGADEPYLKVGGRQVWSSQSLNDGQSAELSGVPPISFSRSIPIELWEQDGGFLDPDDFLGSWTVRRRDAGGEREARFNGDDADYVVRYRVKK